MRFECPSSLCESRAPHSLCPRTDIHARADRSPLYKASRIKAPLLLLQGTADKIVPPEQSEVMLERVRASGGTADTVLFEGEGHGFRAKEAVKVAMERELAWYRKTWGIAGEA